jgi:hypothetical protein
MQTSYETSTQHAGHSPDDAATAFWRLLLRGRPVGDHHGVSAHSARARKGATTMVEKGVMGTAADH